MFSLNSNERLVAGINMKIFSDGDEYSELVNIYTVRTIFFFENINGLFLGDVYFGNIYSCGFTKEKIRTVAVSGKYNRDDLLTKTLVPHTH